MGKAAALLTPLLVFCTALPAVASSPRTVVVEDFNGNYTTLVTTIFAPEAANPANWPWVFIGFGPPAAGVEETVNTSPSDPAGVGVDSAWRYNMPNQDTAGEPFMPFAALIAWFANSFGGETWDTLSDYLIGMGELPVDWQQPVTFEVDVFGLNAGTANFWQQRIIVDQAAGSMIDDTNAALSHPVGGSPAWETISVIMNGQPNPPQSSFLLELAIDFQIVGDDVGQNFAIFDYLRLTYTPQALAITESSGTTQVAEEGATSDTYEIRLTAEPTSDVMVALSTDGQCQITSAVNLTFTDGMGLMPWDQVQNVTVKAVDDLNLEDPVHDCVVTHTLSSSDPTFDGLTEVLVVTVLDNEQPTPTVTPTATPTVTSTVTPTVTPTVSPTPTDTPVPQGGACTDASQCATALFCVNGVCCDTPCDGPMEFCTHPPNVGTCTTVESAPAPATSRAGLLLGVALLVVVAAFALRRARFAVGE